MVNVVLKKWNFRVWSSKHRAAKIKYWSHRHLIIQFQFSVFFHNISHNSSVGKKRFLKFLIPEMGIHYSHLFVRTKKTAQWTNCKLSRVEQTKRWYKNCFVLGGIVKQYVEFVLYTFLVANHTLFKVKYT